MANSASGSNGAGIANRGTDLPFSDCYLVSESGREFPSVKGLLALKSPMLRDLVSSCRPEEGSLRIPLTETDEVVQLFWRQLHGVDPPLDISTCMGINEVADLQALIDNIFLLAEPAHKYDYAECIELIDVALALPAVFDAVTGRARVRATEAEHKTVKDKKKIMQIWSLACQYNLHRAIAAIEDREFPGLKFRIPVPVSVKPVPPVFLPVTVDALNADQCLKNLSATGLHNAATSLIRILNKYLKYPEQAALGYFSSAYNFN